VGTTAVGMCSLVAWSGHCSSRTLW